MQQFTSINSRPISINASTEAQVYLLFAVALGLTAVGTYVGMMNTAMLLSSGVLLFCIITELAIIISARWWMETSPLNYLLFGLFPFLSGFTFTPYLISLLANYTNGASILMNAAVATTFLSLAAAVFARTTQWNMGVIGRTLFFSVLGLLILGIMQIFIPSLRTGTGELMISGLGIVVFGLFTAYDLQRIQEMGKVGANPFLLAISLYLDIFNAFLYILRFMTVLSGNRR
jgi:uncharacterized protein